MIDKAANKYTLYVWIYMISVLFRWIHIAKNDQTKSPRTGIYNSVSKLPAHFYFIFRFFSVCCVHLIPHLFKVRKQASDCECACVVFFLSRIYFFGLFWLLPLPCSLYLNSIDAGFVTLQHTASIVSCSFFMLICIRINSNHCLCSLLFIPFVCLSFSSSPPIHPSRHVFCSVRVYNFNIELCFVEKEREAEIKMVSKNMLEKRKRINNKYIIRTIIKKYCLVLMMVVEVVESTHAHTLCKKQLMSDLKYRYKIYQLWNLE